MGMVVYGGDVVQMWAVEMMIEVGIAVTLR